MKDRLGLEIVHTIVGNWINKHMKTRSKDFILGEETPWEPAGEGVCRQIMAYDGQVMLVQVKFVKGAIGLPHEHFHSQASFVVSGKFEVEIGEQKKVLSAGDSFYVEPDMRHGVVCLEAGVLIDTFTPMRLDFLKQN